MTPAVCLLLLLALTVACWVPLIAMYVSTERAFMRPRLVAVPHVVWELPPYQPDWIGHV